MVIFGPDVWGLSVVCVKSDHCAVMTALTDCVETASIVERNYGENAGHLDILLLFLFAIFTVFVIAGLFSAEGLQHSSHNVCDYRFMH